MNEKIIILIVIAGAIGIALSIVVLGSTQNETVEEKTSRFGETDEINSMLKKIEDDKIKNEQSENPYYPEEREWISSGPFKIDRSQYILGEKIFVNMDNIDFDDKGEMIFTRIINDTHHYEYKTIRFDGSKPQSNYYIGFSLNEMRGLCNKEMLIGNWELKFEGVDFESIKFKVADEIIPGYERQFKTLC